MSTAAVSPYIAVEEYLATYYKPDVDYVDGFIEERNLGEYDHGTLQGVIFETFRRHRREWGIRVPLDTRLQITKTRYRVPDICITSVSDPKEQILRHVPMLCIEILSPEDTLRKLLARAEDYFALGVPAVWLFNPQTRTAHVRTGGVDTTHSTGKLTLAGTPITLNLDEILSALEED